MDRATLDGYITGWLTRTLPADKRDRAHAEWADHGVALLPLGARFSAVRLPERLVHAALGSTDLTVVTEALTARLQGPVIRDSLAVGVPYYALIQWHAGIVWDGDDDTPCLGDGVHLGVPRLGRVEPPGTYWLIRPRHEGDLCRAEAVQQLIQQARAAVAADYVAGDVL